MSGDIITKSNIFVSRWTIKPGKRDEFLAIFNPLWQGSTEFMQEHGNFVFYGFAAIRTCWSPSNHTGTRMP